MCDCKNTFTQFRANFAPASGRSETFNGAEYFVVPVVMARHGIEMNGAYLNEDEMHADSWNGVPVTVGHPDGVSANSPKVLEQYAVGQIFNAEVSGGALRGEAWVNVERANEVAPGLIAALESGEQMGVSTGYFAPVEMRGNIPVYTDVKPDHLALLPNQDGACSFADGCGVRSNRGNKMDPKLLLSLVANALGIKSDDSAPAKPRVEPQANRRTDDMATMRADLIAAEDSPFTGEDDYALQSMSPDTLKALSEKYKPGDKPIDNSAGNGTTEGGQPMADAPAADPKAVFTNEDRQALEYAHKVHAEARERLVGTITANSKMTAEQIKDWPVAQLEAVANGLVPAADYSAAGGVNNAALGAPEDDSDVIAAMATPSTASVIANRRKGVH